MGPPINCLGYMGFTGVKFHPEISGGTGPYKKKVVGAHFVVFVDFCFVYFAGCKIFQSVSATCDCYYRDH